MQQTHVQQRRVVVVMVVAIGVQCGYCEDNGSARCAHMRGLICVYMHSVMLSGTKSCLSCPCVCSAFCDGQVLGSTKASVEVSVLPDHRQAPGMGGTVPGAHHGGFTPN